MSEFDLLIENTIVVTADADGRVIDRGGVAVAGGRIAHVLPQAELEPMKARAAEVIDGDGHILMPGLINMHCHAGDCLFRGLVENLPLEAWLQTVWKAEGAILDPETTRLGSVIGFAEQLLSGVTTVMDMFWYPRATVEAARAVGLRVAAGGIFFDPPGMDKKTVDSRQGDAERFIAEFADADDVFVATMPHGAYTVSPDNLRLAKDIAEAHGALYHVHAAETRAEQADVTSRYGLSVIRHMDHLGLLDERTVLAHCVHLDDEEIAILARTGATAVHNPVSNLKLGSGIARIPELLEAGVRVTLGTDGAISGNDLDMWLAIRLAAMLHKGAGLDAEVVSTGQALAMATREGADALGAGDRLGTLEPGKFADMAMVDIRRAHAVPLFDPVTHLIYSANKSDVRHVFLGGEQVVRDGELTRMDMAGPVAEVQAMAPRIAATIA